MGAGPAFDPVPDYQFYLDGYGGTLGAEAFAEAMSAALRCVRALCGGAEPDETWLARHTACWRRAVCAAAEAFAEFGEGRVGGYQVGDFRITNYRDGGTTGRDVATASALGEPRPSTGTEAQLSYLLTNVAGGFAMTLVRNETQRHSAVLKSAGQNPISLLPLDGSGFAVPSFQLRPVFGSATERVPPNDGMSRFVGFGDKGWDSFKYLFSNSGR